MKESFLALLLAHLLGDFLLQSRSQVEGKATGRLPAFLLHGAIHAALEYFLLGTFLSLVLAGAGALVLEALLGG